MLVYFGKDGRLKEIISSYSLSNGDSAFKTIQGSNGVNRIYCFYEGRDQDEITSENSFITYMDNNDDVIIPADVQAVKCEDVSINFDRSVKPRFFEYEKTYHFAVFDIPQAVLVNDGNYRATSRLSIGENFYSYGVIVFNVEKSAVLKESYITQSQYDYLISVLASKSMDLYVKKKVVNAVNGYIATVNNASGDVVTLGVQKNDADGGMKLRVMRDKITASFNDVQNAFLLNATNFGDDFILSNTDDYKNFKISLNPDKVITGEKYDELNKVMPTDIDYKNGFTLMHDTTEISGQSSKVKLKDGLEISSNKEISVSADIRNHLTDESNPHNVTKAQIGLGSVENKGMDTIPTEGSGNYVTSSGIKSYVDTAVGKIAIDYVIVDSLPTASAETTHNIYLVKHEHSMFDGYDEYITIVNEGGLYSWEKIGNTDIDLSDYYSKSDIVANGEAQGTDTLEKLKVGDITYKIPDMPTNYVPNTRKVNGKALTSDIDLKASDVHVVPTADNSGNLVSLEVDGTNYPIKATEEPQFETYTNLKATPISVGGIEKGSKFVAQTMKQMFDQLLYPYIPPSGLSLSTSKSINGTFEKGTSIIVTTVSWSFAKNDATPTKLVLKGIGADITIQENDVLAVGSKSIGTHAVSTNTSAYLVLTYEKGAITSNSVNARFVDPIYQGVTAEEPSITNLNKMIVGKGTQVLTFSPNKQHIVFAYPKSYGDLRSIKDSNGFENIAGFTKTEKTWTVTSGDVVYNVYSSTQASTATDFKLTFSF